MDRQPTPDIIAQALKRAHDLMREYDAFDLMRALAEATTTAQCQGVQGFRVFAAVREAVSDVLPPDTCLAKWAATAPRNTVINTLKSAYLVESS